MAEKTGDLYVEVAIDADKADEGLLRIRKNSEKAGQQSEAAFRAQWAGHGAKLAKQLAADGAGAGKKLATALREEYNKQLAAGKALRFEGKIDDNEMRARARQAAQQFNAALVGGLKELKVSGAIDESEFAQLSRQLKTAGLTSGRQFGQGVEQGAKGGFGSMLTWIKGIFLLEATQILARVGSAVTQKLRESVGAAEERIRSFTRLSAAAKLFGVDEAELVRLSSEARREYQLTATVANDLAVQTTKLANRADMAAQSQALLSRALDLGAANGADASRVALALDQTLRGLDEGTDLLLGKNPSQIYEEYATSIGKTAGALTDVEQKQALVNAIMAAGEKVQGGYRAQVEGQLGPLTRWRTLQQEASENLGAGLLPLLGKVAELLEGPLTRGTNGFIAFLDRIDRISNSPLENLIKDLRAAGVESERLVALETIRTKQELELERAALRRQNQRIERDPDLGSFTPAFGEQGTRSVRAGFGPEGRSVTATFFDFQKASEAQLEAEIKRVDQELGRMAEQAIATGAVSAVSEARAEALQNFREQLTGFLELRAREVEITDALTLAERTLADIRSGKSGTPAASSTAPAPPTDPGATEAELKRLAGEAQRIRQEMATALAGLTTSAADEAILQLDRLEEEARQVFRQLGEAFPRELEEGLARRRGAILEAGRFEEFARELEALSAATASAQSNATLSAYVDRLSDYVAAHGDANGLLAEGTALRAQFNDLLRRSQEQLAGNEKALRAEAEEAAKAAAAGAAEQARAAAERTRALRDTARVIEENVRGALQLAEAFGVVDTEAARALQNVAQLGSTVFRLAGGDLSAIPSAIGAIAGLITSLRGRGEEEAKRQLEAQRSLLEQLQKNQEAIEANTAAIAGGRTAGEITAGGAASADLFSALQRLAPKIGGAAVSNLDFVERLLKDPAMREVMQEIFQATGIDLLAAAEDSIQAGDKWALAFNNAWIAAGEILETSAAHFGAIADTNVDGQLARFREEIALLDLDTPTEQLEHFFSFLERIGAGNFADQLQAQLAAGDVEGARELVREIFGQLTRGELTASETAGLFGANVTAEQIRGILGEVNGWLEGIATGGGVIGGGSPETRLGVSITEMQGSHMLALLGTSNYHLAGMHSLMRAGAGMVGPLPSIDPATVPAGSGSGGGGTVIDLRGASFPVTFSGPAPAVNDPGAWATAGERFGRGLASELVDVAQGAGIDRPRPRIR